jgi:hypothetical protein
MAGLRWPVWRHQLTQNFGGSRLTVEPKGWFVERDAGGPLRAFPGHFPGGVARPFVHPAIDIGLARGTHLVAVEDGVVKDRARLDSTHERYLILRIRPGVVAFYTHLKDWRVEKDQKVNRGDVIALSGNSGISTGPHLHFEVRIKERGRLMRYNPVRLFRGGDLADDPRIRPKGAPKDVELQPLSPQSPTTPQPGSPLPEDAMPPLLDYLAGQVATLPVGAQVRSLPSTSGTLLRTIAEPERPVVVGLVQGESLAGSERWLMWGAGSAYEFVHESQVESLAEPFLDCSDAVADATAGALAEDPGDFGEGLGDDEPDADGGDGGPP